MKTNGDDTGGTGGTTSMETVRHAHLGWSGHFDCDSRCQYNDGISWRKQYGNDSDRKDNGKAFVMSDNRRRPTIRETTDDGQSCATNFEGTHTDEVRAYFFRAVYT